MVKPALQSGIAYEEDAFVPQARDQFVPQVGISREDVVVTINFRTVCCDLFRF